jgi:hypothetical protein
MILSASQVPGDYLEDEDRHCEEGEQCNSSVYGIASFDKDQVGPKFRA